jgi:hypothetical protein
MPVIIPILNRTEFNASFLGNGGTQSLLLGTVNVVPYYYATLVVRVHAATWSGSMTSLKIDGHASWPTPEDASLYTASGAAITASFAQGTAVPGFASGSASNLPAALQFNLTITQDTGSSPLWVVASADLLLREA